MIVSSKIVKKWKRSNMEKELLPCDVAVSLQIFWNKDKNISS